MSLADHAAPGSAAAFSYQFERALLWLAKSPSGARVGIETADDVAIEYANRSPALEQDKHTISSASPFGDRSKDLWNTLATWVAAVHANEIPEDASFYMVTNATLGDSCIAKLIDGANNNEQAIECIEQLKIASRDPSASIEKHVEVVLDPEKEAALSKVLVAANLIDASSRSAGQPLRTETISYLPLPSWASGYADAIIEELLGWIHSRTLELWQAGKPGWISRDHFTNRIFAALDARKRQRTRERAESLIPVSESDIGSNRTSKFVRQLHLITEDPEVVDIAIREFVRCGIEKHRLSNDADITDDEWISFSEALVTRWKKISGRVKRMSRHNDPRDAGYEIFSEATEDYREKLAGSETDHVYLTSGTYHRLAEELTVGWHPDYPQLMKPKS